ncbi:MAG: hypothetical protein ACPGQI_03240 [Gammaproteobacteria bacterium]
MQQPSIFSGEKISSHGQLKIIDGARKQLTASSGWHDTLVDSERTKKRVAPTEGSRVEPIQFAAKSHFNRIAYGRKNEKEYREIKTHVRVVTKKPPQQDARNAPKPQSVVFSDFFQSLLLEL